MAKSGKFTAKRWERELNSEELLSGLETAINFSNESGREAGFQIDYDVKSDSLIYPTLIYAGTEDSAFLNRRMGLKEANKRFTEETGLPVPSFNKNSEFVKLSPRRQTKCIVTYGSWMANYEADIGKRMVLDYPLTPKLTQRIYDEAAALEARGLEEEMAKGPEEYTPDLNAIGVHTHPTTGLIIPSAEDLVSLNSCKKDNHKNKTQLNPIDLITGTKQNRYENIPGIPAGFPVLILQEKGKEPIDKSTDWRKMSDGFLQLFTDIGAQVFGVVPKEGPAHQMVDNYNLIRGVYVPEEKRIIPTTGDFSVLS